MGILMIIVCTGLLPQYNMISLAIRLIEFEFKILHFNCSWGFGVLGFWGFGLKGLGFRVWF